MCIRDRLLTVIKLTPVAYGCRSEQIRFDIEAVDTHRPRPLVRMTNSMLILFSFRFRLNGSRSKLTMYFLEHCLYVRQHSKRCASYWLQQLCHVAHSSRFCTVGKSFFRKIFIQRCKILDWKPPFLRVRASIAIAHNSYGNFVRLSVRPSVTTRYCFKTRRDRDFGFSPHDSLESLVFRDKISCRWVKGVLLNEEAK